MNIHKNARLLRREEMARGVLEADRNGQGVSSEPDPPAILNLRSDTLK